MQEPHDKTKEDTKKKNEDEFALVLSSPAETITDAVQEVGQQLENDDEAQKKQVAVQTANIEALLKAYKDKFGQDDWYKKHPPKVNDDGSVSLSFKSHQDLADFAAGQAKEGQAFAVVDAKTNQVMAYSNGDGKLYNGDGSEYKSDQKDFKGGGKFKDFKMPLNDKPKEESNVAHDEPNTSEQIRPK